MLLIKTAIGQRWYSVVNSFNQNKLKLRITMMLQQKSSKKSRAKILLALPLFLIAVGAFSETRYVIADTKLNESISVNTAKTDSSVVYLIDGTEVAPESIPSLPSNKIASVSILKNQDSIASYTNHAGNIKQAVLVKTKASQVQKTKMSMKTEPQNNSNTATALSSNPLIIVDGNPIDAEKFKNLSAENIQSITVFKGPSALHIFKEHDIHTEKTDAIVITTKK